MRDTFLSSIFECYPLPGGEGARGTRAGEGVLRSRKSAYKLSNKAAWMLTVLAAILMSGCKVGPNYHRPQVQIPAAFRGPAENDQGQTQAASYANLPWWQVFQDPQLQELVRTALKQNYDLQLAVERINAARAQLAITRSSQFPQVQANGNATGGKEYN